MNPFPTNHLALFLVAGLCSCACGGEATAKGAPSTIDSASGQVFFMPSSGDVNCVYTVAGGTGTYVPMDGGPDLICDHAGPGFYTRVRLGREGAAAIAPWPGDAYCCGVEQILAAGSRVTLGPFTCAATSGVVECRRADGQGFAIGEKRARSLPAAR